MWVLHNPYFVVEQTEVQPQQAGALGGLRGGWEPSSRLLRGAVTWIKCVSAERALYCPKQSKPEMFEFFIYFFDPLLLQ